MKAQMSAEEREAHKASRWCNQPWYVKAYRWLRFKPQWCVIGAWWCARGFVQTPETKRFFATYKQRRAHCWTVAMSLCAYDMGKWRTTEEILEELRSLKRS